MFGKEKIVKTLNVEGMSCMHCVKKVETALKEVKGVKSVNVSLENKTAEVTLKEDVDIFCRTNLHKSYKSMLTKFMRITYNYWQEDGKC